MTAFDWLCVGLAISVTGNILFVGRVEHMKAEIERMQTIIFCADALLQSIADNKVRVERKQNGSWTAEITKGE